MPATYRLTYTRAADRAELSAAVIDANAPEVDGYDYDAEMAGRCELCGYGYHECACDDDPEGDDLREMHEDAREPGAEICLCAECRTMLVVGDDLVQNPVYKCGELSYIELAHRKCLPEWAANDDWQG